MRNLSHTQPNLIEHLTGSELTKSDRFAYCEKLDNQIWVVVTKTLIFILLPTYLQPGDESNQTNHYMFNQWSQNVIDYFRDTNRYLK